MKLFLTILSACCLLACSNSNTASHNQTNIDTTYVVVDSSSVSASENTFEFVLELLSNGQSYEVFRERNRDYSIEFDSLPFTLKNDRINIEEYEIHDLPTGRDKSIIRDKSTNTFYLTDWYNNNAGSDTIKLSILNLSYDSVEVKSSDNFYPDYQVKLKKIWEPTEEYKDKTRIKK